MIDRELLERAAHAAGIELVWSSEPDLSPRRADTMVAWNPFTDDGDALRLAVALGDAVIYIHGTGASEVYSFGCHGEAQHSTDHAAATRRAIVLTAAKMDESTP